VQYEFIECALGFQTMHTVQLLCFVSDVTFLFSRFQKSLQRDSLMLSDVQDAVGGIVQKLRRMQSAPLLGGWEAIFNAEAKLHETADQGDIYVATLHGIQLQIKKRRQKHHHKYVSDRREFSAIRNETLESLINYLQQRLDIPEEVSALHILSELKEDVTDEQLSRCHRVICPDMDARSFVDEYRSAAMLIRR